MNKRYAIVRVDNKCPDLFENIHSKFVCEINGDFGSACKNCRYGDTKEQLVRKIAQALKGTLWNDRKGLTYEEIAKKIVEFLGVEE